MATGYVLFFAAIFSILFYGSGRSANALNMIEIGYCCVSIIPGSVHQYASLKHPVKSCMTDYLDVDENLCNLFVIFREVNQRLLVILSDDYETRVVQAEPEEKGDTQISGGSVNQMNKDVIAQIEQKNRAKNRLIQSGYWFNPVSFVPNQWNALTSSITIHIKIIRNKHAENY